MKRTSQKYWLVFHSRADEAVSAEEKHGHFFKSIKNLELPWGLGKRPIPSCPEFKAGVCAISGMTKYFGEGVSRAMLAYRYRRNLPDDGLSDDSLCINV